MSKVMIIAGLAKRIPYHEHTVYIGVDAGAYTCMQHKIPMECAIGDFDSIDSIKKQELASYTQLICLPKHKDQTDSEAAIHFALERGYEEIILFGGLGGRVDHMLANLYLMMYRDVNLTLMDENNKLYIRGKGTYEITNNYKYLSFLALEKSVITLFNVAYPLTKKEVLKSDIYTISNEIIGDVAYLEIHEGSFLIIQSNDADG